MKKLYLLFFMLLLVTKVYPQDGWFWQNPLPTGNALNDVYFVDGSTGWAVGAYGTIIKTTDGGDNWSVQSTYKTYELKGVCFTDLNHGAAVGFAEAGYGFSGIILRTTDGGNNWIMQSNGASCMLNGVFFNDKYNGIVVGGGT